MEAASRPCVLVARAAAGALAEGRGAVALRSLRRALREMAAAPVPELAVCARLVTPVVEWAVDQDEGWAEVLDSLRVLRGGEQRWRSLCDVEPNAAAALLCSLALGEWRTGHSQLALDVSADAVLISGRSDAVASPTEVAVTRSRALCLAARLLSEATSVSQGERHAGVAEALLSKLTGSERSSPLVRHARAEVHRVQSTLHLYRGHYESAAIHARKAIRLLRSSGRTTPTLVLLDTKVDLVEALLGMMLPSQALHLATQVQSELRRVAGSKGSHVGRLSARCARVCGDAHLALGSHQLALVDWGRALRRLRLTEWAGNAKWVALQQIAYLAGRVGRLHLSMGRTLLGRRFLRMSLRAEHSRARDRAGNLDALRGLEFLSRELAISYRNGGRLVRALTLLRLAEKIAREVLGVSKADGVVQRDLAIIQTDIVVVLNLLGESRASLKGYGSARLSFARLARVTTRTARWHVDLAWLHEMASRAYEELGQAGKARLALFNARRSLKQALRLNPSEADAIEGLADLARALDG